jgi:multidrug efflux pump subunit AcrA (membrane-fusion protein)
MTSAADLKKDALLAGNIPREPTEIISASKLPHWRLLALLTLPVLLAGCARTGKVDAAASTPVVAVVTVERHDLSNTLEIASEFEPYQEIEVYAKVSGYISST